MKFWQAFVCALILSLLSGGAVNVGGSGAATANAAQQEARGFVLPSRGPLPGAETASRVAEDRAAEMVTLINAQRAAVGLPPLVEVRGLDSAAADHNAWMRDHNAFCHECAGEPTIGQRTGRYGYGWSGEIIAAGYGDPREVVNGWMGSPGHKGVILSSAATVGCDFLTVANPPPGQFPTFQTCDFSADAPKGDAVGAAPAPTSTPTTRYIPTLTRTPFAPTATPTRPVMAPTSTPRPQPTWTPYVVWPGASTATPTPTAQAGGAWTLTIEISPWAGAATQQQASQWYCNRYGVICRWEKR